MPWDKFCPLCTSAIAGDMTEDEEEMNSQMEKLDNQCKGKVVLCGSCERYFDYDTDKEVFVVELLA